MKRWIEVIETNRETNMAYICFEQDNPYWATNMEIDLDSVEKIMGCIFEDGYHPFVRISVEDIINRKIIERK